MTYLKLSFRNAICSLVGAALFLIAFSTSASAILTVGETDRGYIHKVGKTQRKARYAIDFKTSGQPVTLIVRGHDIDSTDEVKAYINGRNLGNLRVTRNRGSKVSVFELPKLAANAIHHIVFVPKNPKWYWGVTGIRLVDTKHPSIDLKIGEVDPKRYGYRYGARSFAREISASFTGVKQSLNLRLRGYDIDKDDEVSVLLNGDLIGHLRKSANNAHRVSKFTLPTSVQKAHNTITFRSNRLANRWGINKLSLTLAPDNSLGDQETISTGPSVHGRPVVSVNPGDDIAQAARQASQGSELRIKKGVYRTQRIVPRSRQSFICEPGTIISGAKVLSGEWQPHGSLWKLQGAPTPSTWVSGEMKKGREINKIREDLFIDNRLYLRVDALDKVHGRVSKYVGHELTAGTFYQRGDTIYVADDPRGKLVEMSIEPFAIRGPHPDHHQQELSNNANQGLADPANYVTIKGCIFEKFATHAQLGAIEAAFTVGWTLIDVTARYNHGAGLRAGRNTTVKGGSYSHNGQIGIHASTGPCTDQGYKAFGGNLSVTDAEISFNNWAGFYVPWEAGGIKVLNMDGVQINNNYVHHNLGKGIWTDTEVYDIAIEDNTVEYNSSIGINLEASIGAARGTNKRGSVSNNVIRRNAVVAKDSLNWIWYWGAAILVQNSRDFDISHNTVEVQRGQGISVVNQGFGDRLCDRVWRPSVNNRVFRNTTLFLNTPPPSSDPNAWFHQKSGIESDHQAKNGVITSDCEAGFAAINAIDPSQRNRLFNNGYEFGASANRSHWRIDGQIYRWDNIQPGWETGSTFNKVPNPQG